MNGDPRPAVESAKERFRIYPLERAEDPPAMNFVDISGKPFNIIHANDASFFEEVAPVVQEEPLEATDPETRGLLAAIGIRKRERFAPDAYPYPDSAWKIFWIGNHYEFSPGGVLNLDARTMYYYIGIGIGPAMAVKMVGKGSQYVYANRDAVGRYLDGAKTYRLHLPPNIPVKDFWSVVVYDPQTRSMLQTDQRFPSTGSRMEGLVTNPDGSVDVYFGPEPPPGKEGNWVQTVACAVTTRLDAVCAHLYERAGDAERALAHYRAAAERTASLPERDYLIVRGGVGRKRAPAG